MNSLQTFTGENINKRKRNLPDPAYTNRRPAYWILIFVICKSFLSRFAFFRDKPSNLRRNFLQPFRTRVNIEVPPVDLGTGIGLVHLLDKGIDVGVTQKVPGPPLLEQPLKRYT